MAYFEGQLRRYTGGDEHAGFVLEIEVDMASVANADEFVNEQVAITGNVEIVGYPERGKILVFRATSAAAMEEEEEEAAGTEY